MSSWMAHSDVQNQNFFIALPRNHTGHQPVFMYVGMVLNDCPTCILFVEGLHTLSCPNWLYLRYCGNPAVQFARQIILS